MLVSKYPLIENILNQYSKKSLEVEAKFHNDFDDTKSNIPYVYYERIKNVLDKMTNPNLRLIEESTVEIDQNIRKIILTNSDSETIIWQTKNRIQNIEIPEYNLRISINQEIEIPPPNNFQASLKRLRSRNSYWLVENLIRVDLTQIIMGDNPLKSSYEVEIEFFGSNDQLPIFNDQIEFIFRTMKATNLIYTNEIKNQLIYDITGFLNYSGKRDRFDSGVLVDARNIKRRDLIYGGIVGNSFIRIKNGFNPQVVKNPRDSAPKNGTAYAVTYKADGFRKMLIIHQTGIWLVYPPNEYNLVLDNRMKLQNFDQFIKQFQGTVLDGEWVIPKQGNLNYYFLAFDCIGFQFSREIQSRNYIDRSKVCRAVSNSLKSPLMWVEQKPYEIIYSPEDYFRLVTKFLKDRSELNYHEDGLMFIPIDVVYNFQSKNFMNHERVLIRVPDICKWKDPKNLTIDFLIRWDGYPRKIILESYNHQTRSNQEFTGSRITPFNPEMVDSDHELTKNEPTGTIVEYEFNGSKFIPRIIRRSKQYPNRMDVAIAIWEDITNPINDFDLNGESFSMVFSYHNQIKKYLYDSLLPSNEPINILDIGSGRGGDVNKWIPLKGLIIAVEPNPDHRKELLNRIQGNNILDRVKIVGTDGENWETITDEVQNFIPDEKVEVISLMLSLSFFWKSDQHLDSLIKTIINNIQPGGKIIFFTIDGTSLEQLFEPVFDRNSITNERTIGIANIKLYEKTNINLGRPVDFNLPGTIVGDQREYLVKLDDLTLRLEEYGFVLNQRYRAEDEKLLSENSKLYSSLFSYGIYVNQYSEKLKNYLNKNINGTRYQKSNSYRASKPSFQPIESKSSGSLSSNYSRLSKNDVRNNYRISESNSGVVNSTPKFDKGDRGEDDLVRSLFNNRNSTVDSKINRLDANLTSKSSKNLRGNNETTRKYENDFKSKRDSNVLIDDDVSNSHDIPNIINVMDYDTKINIPNRYSNKIYRVPSINDQNNLLHSILKATDQNYSKNYDQNNRIRISQEFRELMIKYLNSENDKYPGYTYWSTSGRGYYPEQVMRQLQDNNLDPIDFRSFKMIELLKSENPIRDSFINLISEMYQINFYLIRNRGDSFASDKCFLNHKGSKFVVLLNYNGEYQLIVFGDEDPISVFDFDHIVIKFVSSFFTECNFSLRAFDPQETFNQNLIKYFSKNGQISFPPGTNDKIPKGDEFRILAARATQSNS